jgi:hypothetical protein
MMLMYWLMLMCPGVAGQHEVQAAVLIDGLAQPALLTWPGSAALPRSGIDHDALSLGTA